LTLNKSFIFDDKSIANTPTCRNQHGCIV